MRFNFALSLLASPFLVQGESLRGVDSRNLRVANTGFWNETLRECTGATCAVYGDPHVVTCDGLFYDCQAVGLFTLMDNHMFNMQGHFVSVREENRIGRLSHVGGSLLNDAVIDFKLDDSIPVIQLGFGDVSEAIDIPPSQVGCNNMEYIFPRRGRNECTAVKDDITIGDKCFLTKQTHGIDDVYKCRDFCEETDGCAMFNYWADKKCEIYSDEEETEYMNIPASWSMNYLGTMNDECGVRQPEPEFKVDAERAFHGMIGTKWQQKCPLLMYYDGELQDISDFVALQYGYIAGDQNSDFSIQIHAGSIWIKFPVPGSDEVAMVTLTQGGSGPGERWGCHWHLNTCLPGSEELAFEGDFGVGLMGSPDGNIENDWMTPAGDILPLNLTDFGNYDYCDTNWCVRHETESMMALPGNWTWDDVRCQHKEYIPIDINDPDCILEAQIIEASCAHIPASLRYTCEEDCCMGGCDEMPDVIKNMTDKKRYHDDDDTDDDGDDDNTYDGDCNNGGLSDTGETVCPGSQESIVTDVKVSAVGVPSGDEIIYGIVTDIAPNDNGKIVKFKVNNPFDSSVNIYVKHGKEKNTDIAHFIDDKCDPLIDTVSGCDIGAEEITAACIQFEGETPFAIVQVYYADNIFPNTDLEVDQCCHADLESSVGVIQYTFKIQCDCPTVNTE